MRLPYPKNSVTRKGIVNQHAYFGRRSGRCHSCALNPGGERRGEERTYINCCVICNSARCIFLMREGEAAHACKRVNLSRSPLARSLGPRIVLTFPPPRGVRCTRRRRRLLRRSSQRNPKAAKPAAAAAAKLAQSRCESRVVTTGRCGERRSPPSRATWPQNSKSE